MHNLTYYRARYYDPAAGRFIGEDPLGPTTSTDLYQYVENNPVNLIDPFGLSPRKRIPQRWRYCTGSEVQACKDFCQKQGKKYESCSVSQTYRIGPQGWSAGPDWIDSVEGPSCSCLDKDECPKARANPVSAQDAKKFLMMSGAAVAIGAGLALAPEVTLPVIPKAVEVLAH